MNKWLSLWSIGQAYSLADFKMIKDSNFSGVEIWAEHMNAEESFQYAKQCDFEIGLHLPFHDLSLATPYKEIGEYVTKTMKEWIKRLAEHGGGHAVIHGGLAHASENYEAALQRLIERLKELNDYAEEHQVALLFENQIPDKLNYTHIFPSSVNEWVGVLNKTNTKACLDVGHLAVQGDSFKETVDVLGSSLKSIHLSDNDGVSDLHLLPEEGNILQENPLYYLKEINYQGPIVFEINPYKYSLQDILQHQSVTDFL